MRLLLVCLLLALPFVAHAQSTTTGAVRGRVTDADTKEPLGSVSVTIGSQTAFTDENGDYKITELIPGKYDVVFEFEDTKATRRGVVVNANGVTPVYHRLKIREAVFIE